MLESDPHTQQVTNVQLRQLRRVGQLVGLVRKLWPFELHRWLHKPQQEPRAGGHGEPHEVRGQRPARKLLERVAVAQPHVQQRRLRQLERLVGQLHPLELHQGLRQPQTQPEGRADPIPDEVPGAVCGEQLLQPDTDEDSVKDVQQRKLQRLELQRLVGKLQRILMHGLSVATASATIATAAAAALSAGWAVLR